MNMKGMIHRQESSIASIREATTQLFHSDKHRTSVSSIQAIILAGGLGNRMYPLTQDIPKCLLPIANRPLLYYQLELLEKAGFSEAIIITLHSFSKQVDKYITEIYSGKLKAVTRSLNSCGTADAIRQIRSEIVSDFLILSEDILHQMIDIFWIYDATLVTLLTSRELDNDIDKRCVAIEDKRLYFIKSLVDIDESLKIRKSWLTKVPSLTIDTSFTDCHCYLFSHWILDLLDSIPKITSIQEQLDLVPYLVRQQFSNPANFKEYYNSSIRGFDKAFTITKGPRIHGDVIRCYACTVNSFCVRANTVSSYKAVNRLMKDLPFFSEDIDMSNTGFNYPNCVIHYRTLRAAPTCVIINSVIGRHCKFGKNVLIKNSIIMDYVAIDDNSKVIDCILCHEITISRNCILESCLLGYSVSINESYKLVKETLVKGSIEQ